MRKSQNSPGWFRREGHLVLGNQKIRGNGKQTRAGHFRTQGSVWFILFVARQWAEETPLTMYSPQSLHRWGITHSESMERLAYSQGRSANAIWMNDLTCNSHCNILPYTHTHTPISGFIPLHLNIRFRIRQENARVTKTIFLRTNVSESSLRVLKIKWSWLL